MSKNSGIWNQINHKLVKLKLKKAWSNLIESINGCVNILMPIADDPHRIRIEQWIDHMEYWCQVVEKIYQEVWEKQQGLTISQFKTTVCNKAIIPQIDRYLKKIHEEFDASAQPSKEQPSRTPPETLIIGEIRLEPVQFFDEPYDYCGMIRDELERADKEAANLKEKWRINCEIEALELEQTRSNHDKVNQADAGNPPKDESAINTPKDSIKQLPQRKSKRPVNSEVNRRRHLVKNVVESNPESKGRDLDRLTAEELDSHRAEIPEHWLMSEGVDTWVSALKNRKLKGCVQKMFSTDRNYKR